MAIPGARGHDGEGRGTDGAPGQAADSEPLRCVPDRPTSRLSRRPIRPRRQPMSFEDDEYWEAEYSDQALPYADSAAVARDRYPDAGMPYAEPSHRPAPPRTSWADDEFGDDEGYDELAARRQRRQIGYPRSPDRQKRIRSAFDAERPDWLDDPGFARDVPSVARDTPPAQEEGWRRRSAAARVDYVREDDRTGADERGGSLDDWDS